MALSSNLCSAEACERSTLVICDCHNQPLCNDHFIEHTSQQILSANDMNSTTDKSTNWTLEKRSCFTTLNRWCRELYQRVTCSQTENNELPKEPSHHQTIELEQLKVNVIPEQEKKISPDHLFPLERPYRSMLVPDNTSIIMGCSEKHLLIEQKSDICLFDRNLSAVKRIPWSHGRIHICRSSVLDQFILITNKDIFTLDEKTMTLQECSISNIKTKDWLCAACSNTSLYLSTRDMSAFLYEYTLPPTVELVKEWQLPTICSIYEFILTFSYANERLALIVCNTHTFLNRLDVHSSTNLDVLWSISLSVLARCSPINHDQWLIINHLESQILHISFDGKILQDYQNKSSSRNPIMNAVQWDNNTIVTATMKCLNLHKLSLKQN